MAILHHVSSFGSCGHVAQARAGFIAASALCILASAAAAGTTELISVQAGSSLPAGHSRDAVISGNGRFVAFTSTATTLVAAPSGGHYDLYVRDREGGTTERISVGINGEPANGDSGRRFDISDDGRYVVFESEASNLVRYDSNGLKDIFLRDRLLGTTRLISTRATGGQVTDGEAEFPSITPNGRFVCYLASSYQVLPSNVRFNIVVRDLWTGAVELANVWNNGTHLSVTWDRCAMSADGRYVVFSAAVISLDPFDPNSGADNSLGQIFVRDRQNDRTEVASLNSAGQLANSQNDDPTISADGRFVFFVTYATNLFPNDTNQSDDVVARDRLAGTTTLVSVAKEGGPLRFHSFYPSTSADGRYVAFTTIPTYYYSLQVLVRDRVGGQTQQLTEDGDDHFTSGHAISADGRFVTYYTYDTQDVYVEDREANLEFYFYLRPKLLSFGDVPIGTAVTHGFTLVNATALRLPITTVELLGRDRSQYSFKSFCGSEVAPGKHCWISVTFHPVSVGAKQANLHVIAGGIDRHRGLTGTGVR